MAETESTIMEDCLLACFLWITQLALLYNSGPPSQGHTTYSIDPTSISKQENALKELPTGHRIDAFPSFQMNLADIKTTKKLLSILLKGIICFSPPLNLKPETFYSLTI